MTLSRRAGVSSICSFHCELSKERPRQVSIRGQRRAACNPAEIYASTACVEAEARGRDLRKSWRRAREEEGGRGPAISTHAHARPCCCSCALVLRPAKKPLKPPPTAELQAWYNSPDDTAEGDATRPVKIPSVRARASAHAHQARQCVSSCSDLHACHRGLAEYPHASSEHVPLLADAL